MQTEPATWDAEILIVRDDVEGYDGQLGEIQVPYAEVPALITDLRRAYNTWKQDQEQSQADGVVASVLLQSAVAEAPGDFS